MVATSQAAAPIRTMSSLQDTAESFFRRVKRAKIESVSLLAAGLTDQALVQEIDDVSVRDAGELASDAVSLAMSDACGKSGAVRYELVALRDDGRQWGRQSLVIDAGPGSFDSDDATVKGLIVECMRDKRDALRMAFGHTEAMFTRFQAQMDMMSVQITRADEIRLQMFEVLERLTSAQHERNLDVRKAAHAERSKERMIETVMPLIPALANRFVSHGQPKELPEKAAEDPLVKFVKSFSQDQIGQIFPVLTTAQQGAFIELSEAAKGERALSFGPEMIQSLIKSLSDEQGEKIAQVLTPEQRDVFFLMASAVASEDAESKRKMAEREAEIEKATAVQKEEP